MRDFLLRILDVHVQGGRNITRMALSFHGVPPWIILALAAALGALAFLTYRRAAVSPARRAVLASLRTLFLLLILVILMRPVLSLALENNQRRSVAVLIDRSGSMKAPDQRREADDIARVAIAEGLVDPAKGVSQPVNPARINELEKALRIDVVKSALKNKDLGLLHKISSEFDVRGYTFGEKTAPISALDTAPRAAAPLAEAAPVAPPLAWVAMGLLLLGIVVYLLQITHVLRMRQPVALAILLAAFFGTIAIGVAGVLLESPPETASAPPEAPRLDPMADTQWIDALSADAKRTQIGEAVRDVIEQNRGQPLAGIVVVTDGGNNSGFDPDEAARQAKLEGVPLEVWGVGVTGVKDIAADSLFSREAAFAQDALPVDLTFRTSGLGARKVNVKLQLVRMENGREVVDQETADTLTLAEGEQTQRLSITPKKLPVGMKRRECTLRASIDTLPEEARLDNNSVSRPLTVVDGKLQVLLIEQSPRWEFKYLQAMLGRAGEKRFELKTLLFDADRSVARTAGSPYIESFPATREELFNFDVVILGDVDPKLLSTDQVDALQEYVSGHGGSLVSIAGRSFNPSAWRNTKLAEMLPVELQSAAAEASGSAPADRPIQLKLTPEGQADTMFRIADKDSDNNAFWAKLPPVYWVNRVFRAKPGARSLMTDPSPALKVRDEEMPVVAWQQYGAGSVLYVGTDNTWRWRRNAGDKYFTALWGQIVYRMGLAHFMGGSKTTQLSIHRSEGSAARENVYASGDGLVISAALYTKDFTPLSDKTVAGVLRRVDPAAAAGEAPRNVTLTLIPGRPGYYRAEFSAGLPGDYEFTVAGREADGALRFHVDDAQAEAADLTMNRPLLQRLAQASGGNFFREEDLHKLPQILGKGADRAQTLQEVEIWSAPAFFLLLVGVVIAEWILRKASQLK